MIGPAAMKGPKPGIASAPMSASHPNVPPTTPPAVAPVAVPSGAFVFFSAAKSLVDVAGAENRLTVWLVRHSQRKRGATDRPDLRGNWRQSSTVLRGGWRPAPQ